MGIGGADKECVEIVGLGSRAFLALVEYRQLCWMLECLFHDRGGRAMGGPVRGITLTTIRHDLAYRCDVPTAHKMCTS